MEILVILHSLANELQSNGLDCNVGGAADLRGRTRIEERTVAVTAESAQCIVTRLIRIPRVGEVVERLPIKLAGDIEAIREPLHRAIANTRMIDLIRGPRGRRLGRVRSIAAAAALRHARLISPNFFIFIDGEKRVIKRSIVFGGIIQRRVLKLVDYWYRDID